MIGSTLPKFVCQWKTVWMPELALPIWICTPRICRGFEINLEKFLHSGIRSSTDHGHSQRISALPVWRYSMYSFVPKRISFSVHFHCPCPCPCHLHFHVHFMFISCRARFHWILFRVVSFLFFPNQVPLLRGLNKIFSRLDGRWLLAMPGPVGSSLWVQSSFLHNHKQSSYRMKKGNSKLKKKRDMSKLAVSTPHRCHHGGISLVPSAIQNALPVPTRRQLAAQNTIPGRPKPRPSPPKLTKTRYVKNYSFDIPQQCLHRGISVAPRPSTMHSQRQCRCRWRHWCHYSCRCRYCWQFTHLD